MKKIIATVLCIMTMAAVQFLGTAQAADKMTVAGYDKQHATAVSTDIIPGTVDANGYVITVKNPVAVFDREVQGVKALDDPARRGKKVWVATYAENPELFNGATLYAIGLGDNWPGQGKTLGRINLEKALASGTIVNGVVKLQFARQKNEPYWQPVSWIIKLADGKMAWGGHPGYPNGQFIAHTKQGAPLTVWGVENDKIIPPTNAVFAFFKTQL